MKSLSKPLFAAMLALLMSVATPGVARADFFADILHAAAATGGYPADLPQPEALIALIGVANQCIGADVLSDQQIKACVDDAAGNDILAPAFNGNMKEIDFGMDLYFAVRHGEYKFLILKLGQVAGCAAAAILTGVPVCVLADLVISVLGAVADVAAEIVNLLGGSARGKVTEDSYYDLYYYTRFAVAVQIVRFQGDQAWEALVGPMYDGCYHYFDDIDHMTEEHAHTTCNNIQTRFGNEVNAEVVNVTNKGKAAIAGAWDIKAVAWRAEWMAECHLSMGVANAESMEDSCHANVDAALAQGRATAIAKIDFCKDDNALTYNQAYCVQLGYEKVKSALYAAVKPNQEAEASLQGGNIALKKAMDAEKAAKNQFKNDLGAWLKQCPTTYSVVCTEDLHTAWDTCQQDLRHLVVTSSDVGPTAGEEQQIMQGCTKRYDQIVIDYGKKAFGDPNVYTKKFDPKVRDESLMQRAEQARDDSGCPMGNITPTPGQPVDFDVFHLVCETQASYEKCVHSLGGDVRPSASKCVPATGVADTPFVNTPCCSAPRRAPTPIGGPGVSLVAGTDRMGGDYRGFALDNADPQLCRQACAAEGKCKSYTYVNAGVKGPQAMCFLKDSIPVPVANGCCTSGEKAPMLRPQ